MTMTLASRLTPPTPPHLLWSQLFQKPWMLRLRHSHPPILLSMTIWLGLGPIKRRPAKDSPEVKAEGRQSAAPPTCASKDRTEPNGTPQEAAICLWIPFQKKKKKRKTSQDSLNQSQTE